MANSAQQVQSTWRPFGGTRVVTSQDARSWCFHLRFAWLLFSDRIDFFSTQNRRHFLVCPSSVIFNHDGSRSSKSHRRHSFLLGRSCVCHHPKALSDRDQSTGPTLPSPFDGSVITSFRCVGERILFSIHSRRIFLTPQKWHIRTPQPIPSQPHRPREPLHHR